MPIKLKTSNSERVNFNLWMPQEFMEQMKAIQARDGIPLSEQMRRGIQLWLQQQKKTVKRAS